MALPATENFSGAAGEVNIPPWALVTNTYTLLRDGAGHGQITDFSNDGYDYWAADTFPNDQYGQVGWNFASTGAGNNYVYLFLRGTYSGGIIQTGYWFWSDGSSDTAILRVDSGVTTVLNTANSTTFGIGDVMKVTASGSTLQMLKNGTAVLSATDATYAGGQVGLGGYTADGALSIVSFTADTFGGGGGAGTHSGLTGQGDLGVSTPIAIEVDLTGVGVLGTGQGNPVRLFEAGSVSWSWDGVHYARNYFLQHSSEIIVFGPSTGVTHVSYSLAPGITATITELYSL